MKKILTLVLGLALLMPFGAEAAVNKAFTTTPYSFSTNDALFDIHFFDGNTYVTTVNGDALINGVTTVAGLHAAMTTEVLAEAANAGYTLSSIVLPTLTQSDVDARINALVPADFVKVELVTGTVAGGSGVVTIDISGENFTSIEHVIWEPVDDTALYSFGSPSQSTSSVSVTVKKQTFASSNFLLNLLGAFGAAFTGVSQDTAPNGTQVRAVVIGK